jgi:hypothetical protein
MSLRVLITGSLVTAPERKTSAKGTEYAKAHLRVDSKNGSTLASICAFGGHIDELARFRKTDSLSVGGPAELSRWRGRDGEECFALSVTVEQIAGAKSARRPPGDRIPRRPKLSLPAKGSGPAALADDSVADLFNSEAAE